MMQLGRSQVWWVNQHPATCDACDKFDNPIRQDIRDQPRVLGKAPCTKCQMNIPFCSTVKSSLHDTVPWQRLNPIMAFNRAGIAGGTKQYHGTVLCGTEWIRWCGNKFNSKDACIRQGVYGTTALPEASACMLWEAPILNRFTESYIFIFFLCTVQTGATVQNT